MKGGATTSKLMADLQVSGKLPAEFISLASSWKKWKMFF